MKQPIYLDILFLLNMLVTFLLTEAAAHLSSVQTKRRRTLLAALLGGAFSLLIFVRMNAAESFFVKLFTGLTLCFTAFYQRGKGRLFLKCAASFFLRAFCLPGL